MLIRTTLIAALLAAGPALAEGVKIEGTGSGMSAATPYPVGENHIVVEIAAEYESFEGMDGSPFAGMSGPCFGAMEMNAGAVSGGGKCVYSDGTDTAILNWSAEGMDADGATTGSWAVSGGTGRWASAEGGGTFHSMTAEDGTLTNHVTGEVMFKE